MKTKFNLLLALFTISLVFSKSHAQHQISIQTSASNYFFDPVPLNFNIKKTNPGFWNYSIGLQYQFQKPSKNLITTQLNYLTYKDSWGKEPSRFYISSREIIESNVIFSKQKQLHDKVNWTYGFGPTTRIQIFYLDSVNMITGTGNNYLFDSHDFQLGIKGQTALTYTPVKWLTIYGQLNFSGYLLNFPMVDSFSEQIITDFGYKKPSFLPSRLHSSLTFGVGINF
jgi:hypothetical protein